MRAALFYERDGRAGEGAEGVFHGMDASRAVGIVRFWKGVVHRMRVCWGETWRVLAGATRYTYQLTRMALARLGPNGTAVDERGVAGAAATGRRELGYDVCMIDCVAKTRRPKGLEYIVYKVR